MRVFAVSQLLGQAAPQAELRRKRVQAVAAGALQPGGDLGVVGRGVSERLDRQAPAHGGVEGALIERRQDLTVALGPNHNDHTGVVLRGRADHGRAANVDLLEDVREVHPRLRERLGERIEIHAQQVDEAKLVRLYLVELFGHIAPREQARVDAGVKGLDPALEDLREPGEFGDRPDVDGRLFERPHGAARRVQLVAEAGQATRERRQPGLVMDGEKSSFGQ
jgi:hypothetical protein